MIDRNVFTTDDPARPWVQCPDGKGGMFPADDVAVAIRDELRRYVRF